MALMARAVTLEAPKDHRIGAPPQLERTQEHAIFNPAREAHSISANASRESSAVRRPDLSLYVRPSRRGRMRSFDLKRAVRSGRYRADCPACAVIFESAA